MAAADMMRDTFWTDKWRYVDAESKYQEHLVAQQYGGASSASEQQASGSSLVSEIAKAREQIKKSLEGDASPAGGDSNIVAQIQAVANENKELRKITSDLQSLVKKLENRVAALEKTAGGTKPATGAPVPTPAPAAKPVQDDDDEDDDDDIDLFGSDSEDDAELERIKAERIAAYNEKKSKKTAIIAKSSVLLDVKPWDDETDMAAAEKLVRAIEMDGAVWGASKLVPVGYGIKKLQIIMVIEDDKVSVEEITEMICDFEDYVQSVDVAAFNKI